MSSILDKVAGLGEKMGLPPIRQVLGMLEGDSGKRLERLVVKLEKLAQDSAGLMNATQLLTLVCKMHEDGSLEKLDELLKDLMALSKSKTATALLEKVESMAPMLGKLLKE